MTNEKVFITYINEEGWVDSPYVTNATIKLTITEKQYNQICFTKLYYNWKYVNGKFKELPYITKELVKNRRQAECFNIVDNRSKLWYDSLTEEQYAELKTWYQAWLDAPETLVIPTKPEWLK